MPFPICVLCLRKLKHEIRCSLPALRFDKKRPYLKLRFLENPLETGATMRKMRVNSLFRHRMFLVCAVIPFFWMVLLSGCTAGIYSLKGDPGFTPLAAGQIQKLQDEVN